MLKIISSFLVFFCFLSISQAQTAVVDIEVILTNSKVMQHAKKTIEAKTASYQKVITKKENSLRNHNIKVKNKIKSLSQEAGKKEMNKFQKKVESFHEYAKKIQQKLHKKTIETTKKIEDKIINIIERISKKKKISLVKHKSSVLYYDKSKIIDITEHVLKQLDKELTKLEIKF